MHKQYPDNITYLSHVNSGTLQAQVIEKKRTGTIGSWDTCYRLIEYMYYAFMLCLNKL